MPTPWVSRRTLICAVFVTGALACGVVAMGTLSSACSVHSATSASTVSRPVEASQSQPQPQLAAQAQEPALPHVTQGILVELFSSEGCSSCPLADTVLHALDQEQPLPGVHAIALEFHVDYWNDLGWTDPFSSASYTQRQRDYSLQMGKRGVYTPQMIVDGKSEFVGSNRVQADRAIAEAAAAPRVRVDLALMGNEVRVVPHVHSAAMDVYVAEVERGLETKVLHGENAGRTLIHGPIVRSLSKLGTAAPGQAFTKAVAKTTAARSLVGFVVDTATHQVLGAAELR
jgi:hypothetical protein